MAKKKARPLPSPLEAAEALYLLYVTELQISQEAAFRETEAMLLKRYPDLTPLQATLVVRKVVQSL